MLICHKSHLAALLLVLSALSQRQGMAADGWDANDDTYDPAVQSVVIGDRTWIGDPSPFQHSESSRVGYTYVNTTNYEGMDPAVQLSMMIPLAPGETQPAGGGMLMLNEKQTSVLIEAMRKLLAAKQDSKEAEPIPVKTAMEQAKWTLQVAEIEDQRQIQLKDSSGEKPQTFCFSVPATKKLIGAFEHHQKQLTKLIK